MNINDDYDKRNIFRSQLQLVDVAQYVKNFCEKFSTAFIS